MKDTIFALIKHSLWQTPCSISSSCDLHVVFYELQRHAIVPLVSGAIQTLDISNAEKAVWKKATYQNIIHYTQLEFYQNMVIDVLNKATIGVVVIKGTNAACYYPRPELRTMGDIDLLVKPEDFSKARDTLVENGWIDQGFDSFNRHLSLIKNHVVVELHRFFSSKTNIHVANVLDEFLYSDIDTESTKLHEVQNGIVLLEHIAEHIENGIGLRQIIDWMMYVDKCLDDTMWEQSFKPMADKLEVTRLAQVVTKTCQIYLGLNMDNRHWCSCVDEQVCSSFMDYVYSCGNFGQGRNFEETGIITHIPSITNPWRLFRYLQEHGEKNWELVKKHPNMKFLAWAYQIKRNISTINDNHITIKKALKLKNERRKRRKIFAELGVHRENW